MAITVSETSTGPVIPKLAGFVFFGNPYSVLT